MEIREIVGEVIEEEEASVVLGISKRQETFRKQEIGCMKLQRGRVLYMIRSDYSMSAS